MKIRIKLEFLEDFLLNNLKSKIQKEKKVFFYFI